MKAIGLTTYNIQVRDCQNNEYELHDIMGRSLVQIVSNEAMRNLNAYDTDHSAESVFTYVNVNQETVRNEDNQVLCEVLYLRIKTGEYGTESEIVDSITGDTTYFKGVNEADVMPFGCCLIIPAGAHTRGIIIFQSIGRFGITTVMKKYIEHYLRNINDGLRVVTSPVVPRICAQKLFDEGILKSVRLIRYDIPDDDAERYGLDRGVKEITEERVIRKPAGFMRNKANEIREFFNRDRTIEEIVQIDGFEVNDLKFEFKNGKRIKTISLRKLDESVISEDVTEDVDIENGHPTFASLCAVMKETGEYYLRAQGALV